MSAARKVRVKFLLATKDFPAIKAPDRVPLFSGCERDLRGVIGFVDSIEPDESGNLSGEAVFADEALRDLLVEALGPEPISCSYSILDRKGDAPRLMEAQIAPAEMAPEEAPDGTPNP